MQAKERGKPVVADVIAGQRPVRLKKAPDSVLVRGGVKARTADKVLDGKDSCRKTNIAQTERI